MQPPKGQADYFDPGSFNARCSLCGAKRKDRQLRKHWQGQWRCDDCWDTRQPQDFARGIKDDPSTPFVQNPGDLFIITCTINGQAAIGDLGIAGCMRAENNFWSPEYT